MELNFFMFDEISAIITMIILSEANPDSGGNEMKKIIRNNIINLLYSLHDGAVIGLEAEEDRLLMKFQYGFIKTTEPFEQVNGNIEFERIDWDFSFVYFFEYIDVLCGNAGHFTGRKMSLKEFISQYNNSKFDIMDETYGYNMSKFSGYITDRDSIKECIIEIYHMGDMSYIAE